MIDIPPIILNFVYVMFCGILTLIFMKISCSMFIQDQTARQGTYEIGMGQVFFQVHQSLASGVLIGPYFTTRARVL